MRRFYYSLATTSEQVSASAPIILRGDWRENFEQARRIGYDAIEIQLRNPETIDTGSIRAYMDETGMKVSALATGLEYSLSGLSMISEDTDERKQLLKKLLAHVELASKLNSMVIIGCVRGNIPDMCRKNIYLKRFRDGLLTLSDYAGARGVTVVLEAINMYVNNYLNNVDETCDFIEKLGRNNVYLHIDTHHMNIEDYDMLAAIHRAGKLTGYVHFAEINRMYPGAGKLDFAGVSRELETVDYHGYISLECIPRPDQNTAAQEGFNFLHKIENREA